MKKGQQVEFSPYPKKKKKKKLGYKWVDLKDFYSNFDFESKLELNGMLTPGLDNSCEIGIHQVSV